jgi:hypothetical protein
MSPAAQTLVALGIVAVAAGLLVRAWFRKRRQPGCGGDCGAVSPEIRRLQDRIR